MPVGKSGGSRPQCKKLLGAEIQSETRGKPATCNMPLNSQGECPEHSKDIKQVLWLN